MSLRLALAKERKATINEETWRKALGAHPDLAPAYEAAKADYLENAMRRLSNSRRLNYLCWLIERRHPDLFTKPSAASQAAHQESELPGLADEILERARAIARERAAAAGAAPHGNAR